MAALLCLEDDIDVIVQAADGDQALANRERTVLRLAGEGLAANTIAAQLHLTQRYGA